MVTPTSRSSLNKFQWSRAHAARPERTIDMQTRSLTEKLLVSSQLTLTDLTAAADQGIRSIINNRPEGEVPAQPTPAEIEAAAAALGLGYRHIPVASGQIHD